MYFRTLAKSCCSENLWNPLPSILITIHEFSRRRSSPSYFFTYSNFEFDILAVRDSLTLCVIWLLCSGNVGMALQSLVEIMRAVLWTECLQK